MSKDEALIAELARVTCEEDSRCDEDRAPPTRKEILERLDAMTQALPSSTPFTVTLPVQDPDPDLPF